MGDRVVELAAPGVLHQRHRAKPRGLQPLVQALFVDRHPGHLIAPAPRGRFPVQPVLEVVDQQRLDVGGVAVDLGVVGLAPQGHQGAGQDVHEAPDELLEGRRLAFRGQLPGDPGGDLGDAGEASHRVVACRDLRVAEVEQEEVLLPPCPLGFRIDAAQQVNVALGVEDDHHLAAADVLTDEQFRQPRLAHPGGAQHQGVADPLTQIHPDLGLRGLDTV